MHLFMYLTSDLLRSKIKAVGSSTFPCGSEGKQDRSRHTMKSGDPGSFLQVNDIFFSPLAS